MMSTGANAVLSVAGATAPAAPAEALPGFDADSGSRLERLVFNHRRWVLGVAALLTLLLGLLATRVSLNASFEGMLPLQHPYLQNYLAERGKLAAQANQLRIVVERRDGGSILDKDYLEALRRVNDELFLLPGVVRGQMKSLWTPSTRWTAVTEAGFEGGTVMPDDYDGSARALERVRLNIERSGEVGQLVARDFRSTAILVPLAERAERGEAAPGTPGGSSAAGLDYTALQQQLEALRARHGNERIQIRITGFAKVVGDLIDGMAQVALFFALAAAIATVVVLWYTRCLRSTALVMACSLVAVVWQLGLLPLLGFALDPYAVLVPFLVFAIGMSHGAQKMNGVMQDIGRGLHREVAARLTFRRLFIAGFTALACDAVGFAVLLLIEISAIRQLALMASLGVAVLVFTNLILLPVMLSHTGVSARAAARALREAEASAGLWALLVRLTARGPALVTLALALALAGWGLHAARGLQIGDLDAGAPELRPQSRYNLDNAYLTSHYATSSDVLTVLVRTPPQGAMRQAVLERVDELEWRLRQLDGVESTQSLATLARQNAVGMNEGQLRWYELLNDQGALNTAGSRAPRHIVDPGFSLLQVQVFLADHKAETLRRVTREIERFAAEHDSEAGRFLLGAGNAGFEAATNAVVERANRQMLLWVYAAVVLLAYVTFRSWRAVACAVIPLVLTSVLAEALMVQLGIGLKVATLPVVALGVGIGVDYALYVLSILLVQLRQGVSLAEAYRRSLQFTGRVVMLTGVTLAVGVATWAFSPIKFQADMGLLLAFMFIVNMVGALVLLPALAHFLLKPAARAPLLDEAFGGPAG
ncbi:efflux RND transporter permease subunit [Aquabacterium sp. OR-4]|uniref:efflux RND transporter permease subunit n=1 Tax=Aquabacterium sp. OR-4 TaxID=2978127 RepID=UPI0028CA1602|nr:MMPL family transporter [Aquabacterium sp. OR-4]MDT7838983.1 MMPL family transporter [Aquabacterium sp. OR-4]